MPKQIALAYGIAGLAVAVALLVVLGSSIGLFEDKVATEAVATEPVPAPLPAPTSKPATPLEKQAGPALAPPVEQAIEYVYVDEPAPKKRRHHDDDDDDREESDDDRP